MLSIVKTELSVAEAARRHGLTGAEIEQWQERFLSRAENVLGSRPKDDEALKDEQIKKLKQKIGGLVLDNDILQEALKPFPLDRKTSDAWNKEMESLLDFAPPSTYAPRSWLANSLFFPDKYHSPPILL